MRLTALIVIAALPLAACGQEDRVPGDAAAGSVAVPVSGADGDRGPAAPGAGEVPVPPVAPGLAGEASAPPSPAEADAAQRIGEQYPDYVGETN